MPVLHGPPGPVAQPASGRATLADNVETLLANVAVADVETLALEVNPLAPNGTTFTVALEKPALVLAGQCFAWIEKKDDGTADIKARCSPAADVVWRVLARG